MGEVLREGAREGAVGTLVARVDAGEGIAVTYSKKLTMRPGTSRLYLGKSVSEGSG